MTSEEAFNVAINTHPSIYASDTEENAKYKYFDHILIQLVTALEV